VPALNLLPPGGVSLTGYADSVQRGTAGGGTRTARGLLALLLLAGVIGMHSLGAVGTPATTLTAPSMAVTAHANVMPDGTGEHGGGHDNHQVMHLCLAVLAVAGFALLLVLLGMVVGIPRPARSRRRAPRIFLGRAPPWTTPTLAELSILRELRARPTCARRPHSYFSQGVFSMRITSSLPAVAAATVLGLTLVGCSGNPASSTPPASTSSAAQPGAVSNDVDVTFVQGMYPHHAQAVEMATMIEGRTTTPSVVQLATAIKGAQEPEMDTMTTLLKTWNKPAPATAGKMPASMPGMDHTSAAMPGMMSDADMNALAGLSGTAFDQKWLSMMVAHHQGAIAMATTEIQGGSSREAKQLATSIIAAQKSESQQMNALLAR